MKPFRKERESATRSGVELRALLRLTEPPSHTKPFHGPAMEKRLKDLRPCRAAFEIADAWNAEHTIGRRVENGARDVNNRD